MLQLNRLLIPFILLFSFITSVIGQVKLSGLVINDKKRPIEFATVILLKAKDSILVKGGISNKNGSYVFEHVKPGEYRIVFSLIGYQTAYSSAFKISNQSIKLPDVILQSASEKLNDNIIAAKAFVDISEKDTLANNIDISKLDALINAPGVTEKHDSQIAEYILQKDSIIRYKIQLADAYCKLGAYNKASICYNDLYKVDSNNITVITGYIDVNEKISQTKKNIGLYRRLIKINPSNTISYYYKIAPLLEKHLLLQNALEAYNIIFSSNSKDWETAIHICDLFLKLGLQNQADNIIDIAMKYNPDVYALHYKKGGIAYLLEKYDRSIQHIQKAFSCGDTAIAYFKTIGLSYYYIENYDSALRYLSAYLAPLGNDEKCYSVISNIYAEKGNQDSAAFYMAKACNAGLSPTYIQNSKSLAYLYEQKLQYDKALNLYYMIYYTSKDAEAIYGIAHIEEKANHYEKALLWYEKYLATDDSSFRDIVLDRKVALEKIVQNKKSSVWKQN